MSSTLGIGKVFQCEWGISNSLNLATAAVGPCVAMVVHNPYFRLTALAHLDYRVCNYADVAPIFKEVASNVSSKHLIVYFIGGWGNTSTGRIAEELIKTIKAVHKCVVKTELLFQKKPLETPKSLADIHRGFQKSVNGNVSALDLQQVQPTPKQDMCKHMADAGGCKGKDADEVSSRFLNPDVYNACLKINLKLAADGTIVNHYYGYIEVDAKSGKISIEDYPPKGFIPNQNTDPPLKKVIDSQKPLQRDVKEVVPLLQKQWAITNFKSKKPYLATSAVGPCLVMLIHNYFIKESALIHLDIETMHFSHVTPVFQEMLARPFANQCLSITFIGGWATDQLSRPQIEYLVLCVTKTYKCRVDTKLLFDKKPLPLEGLTVEEARALVRENKTDPKNFFRYIEIDSRTGFILLSDSLPPDYLRGVDLKTENEKIKSRNTLQQAADERGPIMLTTLCDISLSSSVTDQS